MKKILIAILLISVLSGCDFTIGMNNEEIITETKRCEDAGLNANVFIGALGNIIIKCTPKETE